MNIRYIGEYMTEIIMYIKELITVYFLGIIQLSFAVAAVLLTMFIPICLIYKIKSLTLRVTLIMSYTMLLGAPMLFMAFVFISEVFQ